MSNEFELRYGCNPHQKHARIHMKQGRPLPIEVLNGSPGYINFLDALNAWQLVKELKQTLNACAAASFKHVSPAGAAIGLELSDALKEAYFVKDMELSGLAAAYARARGADRMSSFGDFVALSDRVDVPTAQLIKREVSDGVIAPDYEPEALSILREKKKGKYNIIRIDNDYEAPALETREVFGITFEQSRNDAVIDASLLDNRVTGNTDMTESAVRDAIIALTALKYTQSNSVCFAVDGQVIGTGAGQQSRIHCTRIAGQKADKWYMRQHPRARQLDMRENLSRAEKNNAIDLFLEPRLSPAEQKYWESLFNTVPQKLSEETQREWINSFSGTVLGSDAFFPFRDSIDRAAMSAVTYVAQPGKSTRDEAIIEACDEYGMVMAFTGIRLFHH